MVFFVAAHSITQNQSVRWEDAKPWEKVAIAVDTAVILGCVYGAHVLPRVGIGAGICTLGLLLQVFISFGFAER